MPVATTDVRYRAAGGQPPPAVSSHICIDCGTISEVHCPTCEPEVEWVRPLCRRLDNLEVELAQANAARELAEVELEAERLKFAKARQKSWALATLVAAAPTREVCAELAEALGLEALAGMVRSR